MLRVHLMQNWFALSDPSMEEALYEIASLRAFARLKPTKNAEGERDPAMHQTKKGNQWHFGMKRRTSRRTPTAGWVWADSGYRGARTRVDREDSMAHRRAAERHRQAARRAPQGCNPQARAPQGQRAGQGRAPFRVIKRQFGLERPLPRVGQEHGASGHAVRAVEPVDGAPIVDGDGESVREAHEGREARRKPLKTTRELDSSGALLNRSNALAFSRCSDLP